MSIRIEGTVNMVPPPHVPTLFIIVSTVQGGWSTTVYPVGGGGGGLRTVGPSLAPGMLVVAAGRGRCGVGRGAEGGSPSSEEESARMNSGKITKKKACSFQRRHIYTPVYAP